MKRPVLWGLIFLLFGIVLGKYVSLPLIGLAFLAGLFLCAGLFRHYKYLPVFAFLLFFAVGLWRVSDSLNSAHTYSAELSISGRVTDIGITAGGNQRATIQGNEGVRYMAYISPTLPWATLGQEIIVTGEVRPLSTPLNPGEYNQFLHLRAQKIDAVIWPTEVSLGETRTTFMVILRGFRDRLAAVYDTLLPPREAAVMRSMVLGDRADMNVDLAQQYRMMGIFHILSISGLHVAVLMLALNKALGLLLSERKSAIIALSVMILYCLMTGAAVSTVRAVTMGAFLVGGKILNKDYDLLTSVSWACVLLLVYEPLYLFNVGFQLSFSAVFGIAALTTPVERFLTKIKTPELKGFRKHLAFGVAVVAATYPVFAFHFYEIATYSVIGNLFIAPTTSIILVLGFVLALVGLAWMAGASVLAGTVYYILRFYDVVSGFFAGLPFAMLPTGGGSLVVLGLGYLVLLVFAYAFSGFGMVFRKRLGLLFIAVTLLAVGVYVRQNPLGVEVRELYTAGNYSVIRHRGDVLITGALNGGESAVLRYLDRVNVRRANGVILTERPQFGDVGRLVQLSRRVDVLYLVGDADSITLFVLDEVGRRLEGDGMRMPDVVWLQDGDVRRAGRAAVQVVFVDGDVQVVVH